MSKLWMAIMFSALGQIFSWFHMQGQFKYEWAKSWWWVIFGGIPISLCFFYGTKWYYEYFQNYWYVRPIGFGMATIVFGILTYLILNNVISLTEKT